jgi:hypothetical protein
VEKEKSGPARRSRTAVIVQTHFFDRSLSRFFDQLAADCTDTYYPIVLMHLLPGASPAGMLNRYPHHIAPTAEVRSPLYHRKSGILASGERDPKWSLLGGGHSELVPLHFYVQHDDYDYYWMIEYDVRFSGNWRNLFRHFESSGADLLATCVRSAGDDPDWMYWNTLERPPGEPPLRTEEKLTCFLPFYRVSRAAMAALDEGYRQGWGGHAEAAVPTILHRKGLHIEDLGGSGRFVTPVNQGRWYSNDPNDLAGAPGSFVARPVRFSMGSEPDMLWHPVKPVLRSLFAKVGRTISRGVAALTHGSNPGA